MLLMLEDGFELEPCKIWPISLPILNYIPPGFYFFSSFFQHIWYINSDQYLYNQVKQKCQVYGWRLSKKSGTYTLSTMETTINNYKICRFDYLFQTIGVQWNKAICSGTFESQFCAVCTKEIRDLFWIVTY